MNLDILLPRIGVGCVVLREGQALLVKSRRRGQWSTPGGNLDFGESPVDCAKREALEETGVEVEGLRFLAITNDVMPERSAHYVTIWIQGEAKDSSELHIIDVSEISDAGWFALASLPEPLHPYFVNLIEGRHLPSTADNPFRRAHL